MKRFSTKDVTAASNPRYLPATHNSRGPGFVREQDPTPSRQPPIEGPTPVSGFAGTNLPKGPKVGEAPPDRLPSKISAASSHEKSRGYGMGTRRAPAPQLPASLPANANSVLRATEPVASAAQIKQESFKYGGGRSAGRLSTER